MYDHAREDDWQIVTRIHNHDELWGPKNETSTKLGFIVYYVMNIVLKKIIEITNGTNDWKTPITLKIFPTSNGPTHWNSNGFD